MKSKLSEIVEERGIKQTWLAKRAGVNTSTLSNIVNGRHLPSIEVALKIAKALNVDIDEIWELDIEIFDSDNSIDS